MQCAHLFELLRVFHNAVFVLPLATTHLFELLIDQVRILPVSVFRRSLAEDEVIEIALDAHRKHRDVIVCGEGFVHKASIDELLIRGKSFSAHNAHFEVFRANFKECLLLDQFFDWLLWCAVELLLLQLSQFGQ